MPLEATQGQIDVFLKSTPIRMPPRRCGICGRFTRDLPSIRLQGGAGEIKGGGPGEEALDAILQALSRRDLPKGLQLLYKNVQRFRGGLVFNDRHLYHSTLGLRAIRQRNEVIEVWITDLQETLEISDRVLRSLSGTRSSGSATRFHLRKIILRSVSFQGNLLHEHLIYCC